MKPGWVIRAMVMILASVTVLPLGAADQVGSATVVSLQVNGDPATHFSLVILGDGYTAADMLRFRAHVDKHLNVLWSIEPFRSYRNYFNVYAVEIVSAQSGITCDPEVREPRDTVLKMQFGGGCTNINARGITGDSALARQYAMRATPSVDQVLVITNTDTYGGIGGAIATTSGGNSLGVLITPHEIGHSLGRLQDEYTYSQRGRAGGPYTGAEPNSAHMTLLSESEMRAQQKKWWRWLGEESLSGGRIARFEGGSQRTIGIWRPSKHSMMISIGYYFDQVSLEQMTRRISERAGLITASTATDQPVARTDVLWVVPAHPVYRDLTVTWTVGDRIVPNPNNLPYLNLGSAGLPPGSQTVRATVVDETDFVRDPEIRGTALTATRTWTVRAEAPPVAMARPAFRPKVTGSTQAQRPVGGTDVVYVETDGWTSASFAPNVTWRLDGQVVAAAANQLSFSIAARRLSAGTHSLTAALASPAGGAVSDPATTRTWTIDNTSPAVTATIAKPMSTVPPGASGTPHYFVRDEFTMKLDPTDDQPGYVVAEFRVNGDGWHHYYGWPDAPPGTPFKFTPRGTTIKELVYGSLSSEGLSPQPWEPREPGWGTHRIEYRGIDAAGNLGGARAFRVTMQPSPTCTSVVTGQHVGTLQVTTGVTCLDGATVTGGVTVAAGASLVAINATITGSLTSSGAATVELVGGRVDGAMRVTGTTGRVTIFGATVGAEAIVSDNPTTTPIQISGSTLRGTLTCAGNSAPPGNSGTANTIARGATGQCGGM